MCTHTYTHAPEKTVLQEKGTQQALSNCACVLPQGVKQVQGKRQAVLHGPDRVRRCVRGQTLCCPPHGGTTCAQLGNWRVGPLNRWSAYQAQLPALSRAFKPRQGASAASTAFCKHCAGAGGAVCAFRGIGCGRGCVPTGHASRALLQACGWQAECQGLATCAPRGLLRALCVASAAGVATANAATATGAIHVQKAWACAPLYWTGVPASS